MYGQGDINISCGDELLTVSSEIGHDKDIVFYNKFSCNQVQVDYTSVSWSPSNGLELDLFLDRRRHFEGRELRICLQYYVVK